MPSSIDKTSSSELSEAINSMFRWYKDASVCYAYLSDTLPLHHQITCQQEVWGHGGGHLEIFKTSKWFSRGWTLQELLASNIIEFYDADWSEIGTKASLSELLARITGIRLEVLRGLPLDSCNVAERMSWAASRTTTRAEDMAYSLLGIFGINLPLLYGEGEEHAFLRLQQAILSSVEDYTIFAWEDFSFRSTGLFARSVTAFRRLYLNVPPGLRTTVHSRLQTCDGGEFLFGASAPYLSPEPPVATSRGLRMNLYAREMPRRIDQPRELSVFLNCLVDTADEGTSELRDATRPPKPLCLRLRQSATNPDVFERLAQSRTDPGVLQRFSHGFGSLSIDDADPQERKFFTTNKIYVTRTTGDRPTTSYEQIAFRLILGSGINLLGSLPDDEGRYLVPGHPEDPIVIMLEHRGHVLVSAGCIDGRPWCHAEDWNLPDEDQDASIHRKMSSWRKDYNPQTHFHSDRVLLIHSGVQDSCSEKLHVELHAKVKRCPGKHTVNNRNYMIFSLQVHVSGH